MPYITQAQLIDRFGQPELIQLTDRDGSAGAIVTAVLDAAIMDASEEIDSYLRVVRTLPLPAPVPARLVRVAGDLARYHLYDDRATEEVRTRYEDAIRWLRDVAAGRASLGVEDPAPAEVGGITISAPASEYDWATH